MSIDFWQRVVLYSFFSVAIWPRLKKLMYHISSAKTPLLGCSHGDPPTDMPTGDGHLYWHHCLSLQKRMAGILTGGKHVGTIDVPISILKSRQFEAKHLSLGITALTKRQSRKQLATTAVVTRLRVLKTGSRLTLARKTHGHRGQA